MPPPQKNRLNLTNLFFNRFNTTKIALAVSLIFSTTLVSAEILRLSGTEEFRLTSDKPEMIFDGIEASITPEIKQNQFTFNIGSAQSITVNGLTRVESRAGPLIEGYDQGTYLFRVYDGGSLSLNGDVNIKAIHPDEQVDGIGNNVFWAIGQNSKIEIGNTNSVTKAWALAKKPDLISAKEGAKVIVHSVHNQFVGNIDFLGGDIGQNNSEVVITFSGSDSYWFGDDQSWSNTSATVINPSGWEGIAAQIGINLLIATNNDYLDLTFENGAQWSYFGLLTSQVETSQGITAEFTSTQKRISKITLNKGGIINLFDENIQQKWKDIGLLDVWSELSEVNHDYVRIGDLKGNNGIFRLDLNSDEPSQSDMIFIESSEPEEPGQHFIEPYRPEDLTSVSDTNRLTFALTAEDANSVSFADKQNIYGNSLFDYELIIGHETITIDEDDDKELIDKINEELVGIYKDFDDFNIVDYNGGTHWYIKRLLTKESAASIGMRSAGYASYDLAVNMDRRDRRLQNAVFQNEEKDGLWARVQYGEAGAEHLYNADLTTVYVGYEKATSVDNRLGFSFAYTDGESDLNDLKGSGDLKRYEASVYDTLTFGSHYLDFVARFGQVDNDFDVTNQSGALTTSGSFDQKYAALSAEYGYNFKEEHNVFIEPQVQLQVAYLGDYNYRTERNMKVDADSDISVIGRVGLRTGKTFESSDYVGELYARADVLHQFTDGQDAQFSDLSDKVNVTWGNKDTWSTFGVGGYLNWKDNVSFQVDVERTAGGRSLRRAEPAGWAGHRGRGPVCHRIR